MLAKRESQLMELFGINDETILEASDEVKAQVTLFLLQGEISQEETQR